MRPPSRPDGPWPVIALTPLVLLVTHYLAVLPHEFTHSILAWALGIKGDPWAIDWGGGSLANILLLVHIDENVDYHAALAAGHAPAVALVALAGPILANGGLYLLMRRLSTTRRLRELGPRARPVVASLVFWYLVMNLANLWCYIPIRTFAADGDIRHFIWATGVSPWLIYAVGGYLVVWAIVDFYRAVLPRSIETIGMRTRFGRAFLLIVATCVLFGYFSIPGFEESDPVSVFLAGTSVLAIPVVVVVSWRRVVGRGSAAIDGTSALDLDQQHPGVAHGAGERRNHAAGDQADARTRAGD